MRVVRRLYHPRKCFVYGLGCLFLLLGIFNILLWELPAWSGGDTTRRNSPTDDFNLYGVTGTYRPTPPICVIETMHTEKGNIDNTTQTTNQERLCTWNSTRATMALESCYEMLRPIFENQPSWVFLGDEGMAMIPYFISLLWNRPSSVSTAPSNNSITARRNHCQNLAYYRLPPPKEGWVAPDPLKGEGPVGYGKEHPFCSDCDNCWNVLVEHSTAADKLPDDITPRTNATSSHGTHNVGSNYVEYLAVEYARDVSIPTLITNTTQETAIYYLQNSRIKQPSVCVASAGVQDAAIDPPISLDRYVQNVDRYLSLLKRTCEHVIWIGIHAVVEDKSLPQTNCRLNEWNKAVIQHIERNQKYMNNVYVVDIWDRSLRAFFETRTKPDGKFYAALGRLFTVLIEGAAADDE